jgi:hypothetical protein
MDSRASNQQSATVHDIIERRRIRREKKAERRQQRSAAMTPAQAIEHARAVATKKELELQKGEKTTRKERSALMKAMKAGVDAAASVGQRINAGDAVPVDMLETAKQQEFMLIQELVSSARLNASGALAVAAQVSQDAVNAVMQGITRMEENQKLSAALSPVTTEATLSPLHVGEDRGDEENISVQVAPVAPAAIGRPPEPFNQSIGDDLCAWIQSGNSLNKWLKQNHRDARTVYRWLRESPSFAQNYAHAHADRADTFVEDMIDIGDKAEQAENMVELLAYKLQIETRRWISERMKPEKYGTKVQVEQKGQVVFNMQLPRRGKQHDVIDMQSTPALHDANK